MLSGCQHQLDLLERRTNFFLVYNIFGGGLADAERQSDCVNKTELCLSQWENVNVGFFCTFIELWVAFILGNSVVFNVV